MTLTTRDALRDDFAAAMVDGIHAMARQDLPTLERTIHPSRVRP